MCQGDLSQDLSSRPSASSDRRLLHCRGRAAAVSAVSAVAAVAAAIAAAAAAAAAAAGVVPVRPRERRRAE